MHLPGLGDTTKTNKIKAYLVRPTVIMLVFLLLTAPVYPVFAEEIAPVQSSETVTPVPAETPAVNDNLQDLASGNTLTDDSAEKVKDSNLKPEPDKPEKVVEEKTDLNNEKNADPAEPTTTQSLAVTAEEDAPTDIKASVTNQAKANIDLSTGALSYSYPFELPEGRAGMTPELSLNYNSRNANRPDSFAGMGWEFSIPYIQREPVKGVNNLFSKAYFSSSMSGNLIATTDTSSSQYTIYRPETDNGEYLKYTYNSNNTWTMTDKDGRIYTFGGTSASRQDNPSDSTKVYKWMVSKVSDHNGNEIQYSYIKDSGQIYPSQILYTYHASAGAAHTVTFTYTAPTNYGATVYNSGFAVTTYKLISSIAVATTIDAITATHTYTFNFVGAQFLNQKLLSYITHTYNQPSSVYSQTFTDRTSYSYSNKSVGWEQTTYSLASLESYFDTYYDQGSTPDYNKYVYKHDFDGNGYEDLFFAYLVSNVSYNKLMLNNGSTFVDATSSWNVPAVWAKFSAFIDVNGDRLPDILNRRSGETPVYLNTGSGFAADNSGVWDIYNYITEAGISCEGPNADEVNYTPTFLYDIDRDGKNDIVYFGGPDNFQVAINNGAGWTLSDDYSFTDLGGGGADYTDCDNSATVYSWQTLMDVNGDGLEDYVRGSNIFLRNDDGFEYSSAYSNIGATFDSQGYIDVNGDGLIDYVWGKGSNNCRFVFLNNGSGFTMVNPSDNLTTCTSTGIWDSTQIGYTSDSKWRGIFLDVTGDNFTDIIGPDDSGSFNDLNGEVRGLNDSQKIWNSPGSGWIKLVAPLNAIFYDFNNDGVMDYISPKDHNGVTTLSSTRSYMGKGSVPNRLIQITTPLGAQTNIDYSSASTNFDDNNAVPMPVVKKISTETIGQNQPSMVTQYSYTGGSYFTDPATKQKRFAGFQKVTATESGSDLTALRITDTYFHQANGSDSASNEPADNDLALIGKSYYSVIKHPTGNPKKETWNKYGKYTLVTEPVVGRLSKFVYPTETVNKTTESSTATGTAELYTFNTTLGEQTELQSLGFVTVASDGTYSDISGDTRYQFIEYANNFDGTIVKPSRKDIRTTASSADTIARTEYYYDSQSLGTIGSLGNLSKESNWIAGNGSTVADTTYTYDSFGNVLTMTNPRIAITTYVYDSSKSRVASETNHLNQVTAYEYLAGKLKKITDPNGRIITYEYSSTGWLYRTNIQNTGGLQTVRQMLRNMNGVWGIETYSKLVNTVEDESDQIIDNLGRPTRKIRRMLDHSTGVNGGYYLKEAKTYDVLGREVSNSAEYGTSDTSAYGSLITVNVPTNLVISTTYDVFDRPLSVANSIGTTTMSYSGPETTVTDANNHQKKTYTDAYGNLIQVKEYNGTSIYTTDYSYESRNLLTNITDALGNTRNFIYNNAGWLTNSEDLHASADATFGAYQYTYDLNGNKLVETQPNGTTVTRVYDMLDRPTSIDGSSTIATDYTLVYDNCTNGKGRVCTVNGILPNNTTLTKSYVYGISGVPTSETLTTLGNSYTTSHLYNYSDEVSQTTYQNGTIVRQTFGEWALPNKIYTTMPGGSETLYSSVSYHHTGKPSQITFGVNRNISYTYDDNKLYRLTRKQTRVPQGNPTTVQLSVYTGDGYIYNDNSNWNTGHNAASGTSANNSGTTFIVGSGKSSSTNYRIQRAFVPFDTSSLPDGVTISDAKLKVYAASKLDDDNDGDDWLTVVQSTQGSVTSLSTSNYDDDGAITNPTEGVDVAERKDITNVSTGAYLTFTLNATGRGWIDTAGSTKLGIREGHDAINSSFTGTSGKYDSVTISALNSGTGHDPILEVTYPTGTLVQDSQYTYDNVNNITGIAELNTSKTYSYDDLNRLTQSVYTGSGAATYTYAYDAIGNITSMNGNGYVYAGTGKTNPHAVTSVGASNYTYDDNGNMLSAPNQSLTWNWQNQPTRVTVGGTSNIDSYYDESGQRFIYQIPGTTEVQVNDDYLVRGGTPEISIRLGGTTIGTISNNAIYSTVTDHLNTPIKQINSSDTIMEDVTYDPYGKVLSQTGSVNTKRGYTGHEEDVDTGLVYAGARYYNPVIARFVSQDPVFIALGDQYQVQASTGLSLMLLLSDPQSLNSYSYAKNNPLLFVDPNGEFWTQIWEFSKGAGNAVLTNNALGYGRVSSSNVSFQNGQRVGDVISLIQGSYEAAAGIVAAGTGAAGAVALSPTGIGAVAGVGVSAAGLAGAAHGSAVAGIATHNLFYKNSTEGRIWTQRDKYNDSIKSAYGHYDKHKMEFPEYRNAKEYVEGAHQFYNRPPKGTLYRSLDNGREAYYNQTSNKLLILQQDGPATYMRPKLGIRYFNSLK